MSRVSVLLRACACVAVAVAAMACSDAAPAAATAAPEGGASTSDALDAAASSDAAVDGGALDSPCTVSADHVTCNHSTVTVAGRTVAFAVPSGAAPAGGWPLVVFFQGSFVAGESSFAALASDSFGRYALTRTIAALLDRGYVVVAPNASANGTTFWETNIPPFAQSWAGCADDVVVRALLDAITGGTFGAVDAAHLYAMGISSGGFMTSRMAVSYPGKFRALVDHSGSYATCGQTCTVPTPLPADHPPTLFFRGDSDTVVPMSVVTPYVDALVAEGHEAKLVLGASAGHEWVHEAIDAVPSWFDSHR